MEWSNAAIPALLSIGIYFFYHHYRDSKCSSMETTTSIPASTHYPLRWQSHYDFVHISPIGILADSTKSGSTFRSISNSKCLCCYCGTTIVQHKVPFDAIINHHHSQRIPRTHTTKCCLYRLESSFRLNLSHHFRFNVLHLKYFC